MTPERELAESTQELSLSYESIEILTIALKEAQTFGRGYFVDTADLLVGLSQVGNVGEMLNKQRVIVEKIRQTKELLGGYDYFNRIQPPTPTALEKWSQIPRTIRMRKIGSMLTKRAISKGMQEVTPSDILETIIEERDGLGAKILRYLQFEPKKFSYYA